jgi:2-polyprenyl-3-methyl-5-hydroxy-6-metoxy-1,4-benzoquinol methylase
VTGKTDRDAPRGGQYSVCPWWLVKSFDNPFRRLFHDPQKLFGPYVGPGMTAVDVGCGGGFASLGLAQLVGDGGKVIAADLQPEMLGMVRDRAERNRLSDRIQTHRCAADRIGVKGPVDFVLAFWMLHEVPDTAAFLSEVSAMLAPGGHFFVAEPLFHVTRRDFLNVIEHAAAAGLAVSSHPKVAFSRSVVFIKEDRRKRRDQL